MGANTGGIQIFMDFMGFYCPWEITEFWLYVAKWLEWKYKSAKLFYLPKPQKFKPLKLTTHTVLSKNVTILCSLYDLHIISVYAQ